jgi:hypothetical protein
VVIECFLEPPDILADPDANIDNALESENEAIHDIFSGLGFTGRGKQMQKSGNTWSRRSRPPLSHRYVG